MIFATGMLARTKTIEEIFEDYCGSTQDFSNEMNAKEGTMFKYNVSFESFKEVICDYRGVRIYNLDENDEKLTHHWQFVPYNVPLLLLKELILDESVFYQVLFDELICYVNENDIILFKKGI